MLARKLCALALVPLMAVLIGCGGGKKTASANVSGKVLLNGVPLPGGNLTLFGSAGGGYSDTLSADGDFRIVDLPPGEYTAVIDNEYLDPNRKQQVYKGGDPGKAPGGAVKGSGAMASKYGSTVGGSGGAPANTYKGKGVELHAPEGATTVKEGNFVAIPAKFKKKDSSGVKVTIDDGDNKKDISFDGK